MSVEHIEVDYLIIGGGPAGVQAAYYLAKAGHNYLIAEGSDTPGAFFQTFPRHRTLISSNKKYTGWDNKEMRMRVDWNSLLSDEYSPLFTDRTNKYFPPADEFVGYMADYVKEHNIKIRYNTRLGQITRPDDFLAVDQNGNTFKAKRIIVATGMTKPNMPKFEGAELCEQYMTMTVDPEDFTNQRVLIVGRGNSAFETADNLISNAAVIHVCGAGSLKLAWKTHFVGHLRAVNNNFLDTYQLKSQNALLDGTIQSIRKDENGKFHVAVSFCRVNGVVKEISYDRVLLCTGFRWNAEIFSPECRPELTIMDRFPNMSEQYESVNIPDVYFAGTITQMRDFKKSTSGFIHGFRYGSRTLTRILDYKYHQVPYAVKPHNDLDSAINELIVRINTSSCLWQQFGHLGDVVVYRPCGTFGYLEEMPMCHTKAAVPRGDYGNVEKYAIVTLEYGEDAHVIDPFDVNEGSGLDGRYLHPVVRMYCGKTSALLETHHMRESLENEWDTEEHHRIPLRKWMSKYAVGTEASKGRMTPPAACEAVSSPLAA